MTPLRERVLAGRMLRGEQSGEPGVHPRAETGSPQVLSYLPGLLSNAEGTQVTQRLAAPHCLCLASCTLGRWRGLRATPGSRVLLTEEAAMAWAHQGQEEREHLGEGMTGASWS